MAKQEQMLAVIPTYQHQSLTTVDGQRLDHGQAPGVERSSRKAAKTEPPGTPSKKHDHPDDRRKR
jgi:hypothetical protein